MIEVIHGLFESCPTELAGALGLCDGSASHGFAMDRGVQARLRAA